MDTRVQVAAHFTVNPAKLVVGAIEFPSQVTVTLAVGDQIEPQKVDFDVAFTVEQRAKIEEKLNTLIIEAGRTAKPVEAPAAVAISPPSPDEAEGALNLFD
ncbi:MAG: hypothetical protein WDA72_01295 [Desulfomonilia bacterium]